MHLHALALWIFLTAAVVLGAIYLLMPRAGRDDQ
jgi:hypothetical protein